MRSTPEPRATPSPEGSLGYPGPSTNMDELHLALEKEGILLLGPVPREGPQVLSEEAIRFVATLARHFGPKRDELLGSRARYQRNLSSGNLPSFALSSVGTRRQSWEVNPPPSDLRDRRVEITGPTDRKMMINALNSGAQTFMADLEDAHAPVWSLTVQGQQNLYEAVRGRLELVTKEGKQYRVKTPHATLMVRPRGLHLEEPGLQVDGRPVPASLFDLGLYAYHNAHELRARDSGVYLYLPKIQSAEEALWWEGVLAAVTAGMGLPPGGLRVTVLIETLPALFQMHEILHALKPHALGLNFGRWDYLFSFVKTLRTDRRFMLPERGQLTMEAPFLVAASKLLVETCHARGAQAIGGMAADIPVKEDAALNSEALSRVTADKRRELSQGYDGTWVAHPALVPVALEVFRTPRSTPTLDPPDFDPMVRGLLSVPSGEVSEAGVRADINVAVQYLESWIRGVAAVAIHARMEDTATAEICRAQLWQWVHLGVRLADGRSLTLPLFRELLEREMANVRREVGEARWSSGEFPRAQRTLDALVASPELEEFLTLRAPSRASADLKVAA